MVDECQKALQVLLPLTKQETAFFDQVSKGEANPELICNDQSLSERIKQHPALQRKIYNLKRNQ